MKPVTRYQSQLLFRKSYKPERILRFKSANFNVQVRLVRFGVKLQNKTHECQKHRVQVRQDGCAPESREIPPEWRRWFGWQRSEDYAVDIQKDRHGQFFELRVPTHLKESLDLCVMQSEPKQRHLLLAVRKSGDKPQLDRFLCGHDEREWSVAAVPGGASSVRQALSHRTS